jgi:hypothetical protein
MCRIKGEVSFSGDKAEKYVSYIIVAISCLTTGKPEGKWLKL